MPLICLVNWSVTLWRVHLCFNFVGIFSDLLRLLYLSFVLHIFNPFNLWVLEHLWCFFLFDFQLNFVGLIFFENPWRWFILDHCGSSDCQEECRMQRWGSSSKYFQTGLNFTCFPFSFSFICVELENWAFLEIRGLFEGQYVILMGWYRDLKGTRDEYFLNWLASHLQDIDDFFPPLLFLHSSKFK